jgi:hypothetical protein
MASSMLLFLILQPMQKKRATQRRRASKLFWNELSNLKGKALELRMMYA